MMARRCHTAEKNIEYNDGDGKRRDKLQSARQIVLISSKMSAMCWTCLCGFFFSSLGLMEHSSKD